MSQDSHRTGVGIGIEGSPLQESPGRSPVSESREGLQVSVGGEGSASQVSPLVGTCLLASGI